MALPLNSVLFCATLTSIICLINITSSVAFNAIVSLTIAGLYSSYFIPIALVAWKRLLDDEIKWGPWKLGKLGFSVNLFSLFFLAISIIFSFFPPGIPVTLVSMNWSILVFGGAVVLGLIFYVVRGHKNYNGPIVERGIIPLESGEWIRAFGQVPA
jgi:choline transport protein